MTHCDNLCILFFLFLGHQIAYWLGPFDKSFSLSLLISPFPCPFDKSFYLSFLGSPGPSGKSFC